MSDTPRTGALEKSRAFARDLEFWITHKRATRLHPPERTATPIKMSQTPRTDAELIRMADAGCPHIVHGDFAREALAASK